MSLLQIEEKDGEREGEERERARVSEQDRVAGRDGSSAVRQEQAASLLRLSLSEQERDTHSQGDFVAHQPLSLPAMAILYRHTHTHTHTDRHHRERERESRKGESRESRFPGSSTIDCWTALARRIHPPVQWLAYPGRSIYVQIHWSKQVGWWGEMSTMPEGTGS
eukprot:COSAG03_NODE_1140_length_4739_cov_51.233405_3_plen_165_part_00